MDLALQFFRDAVCSLLDAIFLASLAWNWLGTVVSMILAWNWLGAAFLVWNHLATICIAIVAWSWLEFFVRDSGLELAWDTISRCSALEPAWGNRFSISGAGASLEFIFSRF